jgi:hypothetical protein
MWLKSFVVASLLQVIVAGIAHAKGPFGSVNVGNWIGGAFSNDETGAFSHCAATTPYANGVILVVSQNAAGTWSLAFASPSYRFNKGENAAIDVTFDGQEQARLFATAYQPNMLTAIMPVNVVRTFQKASLMVATAGRAVLNFDLTSTGPVIAALANCVTKVKADGLDKAGDFTKIAACAGQAGAAGRQQSCQGQDRHRLRGQCERPCRHQQPCDRRLRRRHQGQPHR